MLFYFGQEQLKYQPWPFAFTLNYMFGSTAYTISSISSELNYLWDCYKRTRHLFFYIIILLCTAALIATFVQFLFIFFFLEILSRTCFIRNKLLCLLSRPIYWFFLFNNICEDFFSVVSSSQRHNVVVCHRYLFQFFCGTNVRIGKYLAQICEFFSKERKKESFDCQISAKFIHMPIFSICASCSEYIFIFVYCCQWNKASNMGIWIKCSFYKSFSFWKNWKKHFNLIRNESFHEDKWCRCHVVCNLNQCF